MAADGQRQLPPAASPSATPIASAHFALHPLAPSTLGAGVAPPALMHVFNPHFAMMFAVKPVGVSGGCSMLLHERLGFAPMDSHLAVHIASGGRALALMSLSEQAALSLDSLASLEGAVEDPLARRVSFASMDSSAMSEDCDDTFGDMALILVSNSFIKSSADGKRLLLLYAVPSSSLTPSTCSALSHFALPLVLGIESTLIRYYDLEHLLPPRETELAMLAQFEETGQITLPGGLLISAELEDTVVDPHEAPSALASESAWGKTPWRPSMFPIVHPVIRLHSSHGTLILTRLLVDGRFKSFMVHVRPGWEELRSYLEGKATGNGSALFTVCAVLKHARGNLGRELWRLLGGSSDAPAQTWDELDMSRAAQPLPLDFALCLDNSARWVQSERVWPVRPYEPYMSEVDCALAVAVQALHGVRNDFFARCDEVKLALRQWCANASLENRESLQKQPVVPSIVALLAFHRHRWLQEFQAFTGTHVSQELSNARDYADIVLRNRHHIIVDTNVFLLSAQEDFALFHSLKASNESRCVIVVPFAVLSELDWQKHNARDEAKRLRAQQCIRFINGFVTVGSSWLVLQSQAEDAANAPRAGGGMGDNINGANDLRILAAANSRHLAGLRTILVSGDINLRNFSVGAGVPALKVAQLWELMQHAELRNLPPEHWLAAVQKMKKTAG